jgi:hypothetical protein
MWIQGLGRRNYCLRLHGFHVSNTMQCGRTQTSRSLFLSRMPSYRVVTISSIQPLSTHALVTGHGRGESEEIRGCRIKERPNRSSMLLATKLRQLMEPNNQNPSCKYILEAVEASLRCLHMDYLICTDERPRCRNSH